MYKTDVETPSIHIRLFTELETQKSRIFTSNIIVKTLLTILIYYITYISKLSHGPFLFTVEKNILIVIKNFKICFTL